MKFTDGAVDVTYESVSRDKLRVDHVGALFFANKSERSVGHVFHWSQQNGAFAQVNIADFHSLENYLVIVLSRRLLATTVIELSAIAALAQAGSSNICSAGKRIPAATGIPIML